MDLNILEKSLTIKDMEEVFIAFRMELYIQEIENQIKSTGKAYICFQMELDMMEKFGKAINKDMGLITT